MNEHGETPVARTAPARTRLPGEAGATAPRQRPARAQAPCPPCCGPAKKVADPGAAVGTRGRGRLAPARARASPDGTRCSQLELWSSGGVFVWVILESGGMNMFLQTVGPFQVLGEKLDRTFVLQVGVHLW